MQKLENEFWNHTIVGAGHPAYTDRFHELAKLVPYLVTPEFKRIDRNKLLKRSSEKRKESCKTGKQEDARSDNKRARTRKSFVVIDSGKKEYKGPHPKCGSLHINTYSHQRDLQSEHFIERYKFLKSAAEKFKLVLKRSKGDMKVEAKSSSSGSCGKFIEVVIMLILIGSYYCFIHGYYCSTTVNTAALS
ncbi:hypothetical protein Tco_1221990 [Tanacetum coccineum]